MKDLIDLEELDYDELDKQLQEEIGTQMKELEALQIDRRNVGNPKKLAESISQIVWEQFILQIAGQAGKDFIKQNHDLNLSLNKADHILISDSFVKGEMPSHNFDNAKKYQQRYDSYQAKFKRDANGNVEMHSTRMGTEEATLVKGARDIFDENRPIGSKVNHTSMDHTVSAGEILRDSKAGAFLSEEEKIKFANSQANLNEMDTGWNASKGDMKMNDWLENENKNGQKPDEIFNMSEEDKQQLRAKDAEAREEWEKKKNEGEQRALDEGKTSIRAEVARSTGVTTQAIAVALLAKLTRTIFQELIRWLGEKDRKAKTFFEHLKKAILDFLKDFKNNVLLSIDVGITVILTQIWSEIVPIIRKALLFVKVGGQCVYDVAKYLKSPENANKETSIKVMEIGKIVTVSMTTTGAIGLGMTITSVLEYYVPALAVQIPLLGSPASLLGIFFGGLTAGICGAIVLHSIDGALEGKMISENIANQLVVQNGVLSLQDQQFSMYEEQVEATTMRAANNIRFNVTEAVQIMEEARYSISEERKTENEEKFENIASLLDDFD